MKDFFGIHQTAIVSPLAKLGENVTVGAHSVIYDNVVVGDDGFVGSHCVLGEPNLGIHKDRNAYVNPELLIGRNAMIRSGTTIYAGTRIGDAFECGHKVTIREEAMIGNNVRIGTLSDVQGHCEIGNFVRFHSNVHIGHMSKVEDYVWIFPYVVLTNDPHPPSERLMGVTVEKFAVIATMSVVLPGIRIGQDALVGACSMVRRDVDPETVVVGNPAKMVASVRDIKSKFDGSPIYPWREHFGRGMPWEDIGFDAWQASREAL